MTTPSLKQLDAYTKSHDDRYDFVKGKGYFYFGFSRTAPKDTPEPPPSIYVFALNQMTASQWKQAIDGAFDDWSLSG